jgi:hypothetical protein
MPWPIFAWTGTGLPTLVGWSGSTSTNVNPGVGLRLTDPNSPNYGRTLGSSDTMDHAIKLEKGTAPKAAQDAYDVAKRQLGYEVKSNGTWLILLLAGVIGYFIWKRK